MIPIEFKLNGEILSGDLCSHDGSVKNTNVFFLHGAGKSNKQRTHKMRMQLKALQTSSFGFDFSGHGKSSGHLKDSSLEKRVEEATHVINSIRPKGEPISIIGSSMAGHVSLKLTEIFEVKNLVLFCPGIYSRKAYDVKFNKDFTEIIRIKKSWQDSDAFDALQNYTGNLLVYIGDNDIVIPKGVIDLIDIYAKNVAYKKIYRLPDCDHYIHHWLTEEESRLSNVVNDIVALIKNKHS